MAAQVFFPGLYTDEYNYRRNGVLRPYVRGVADADNLLDKVATDTFANALVAARAYLGYAAGSPPSTAVGLAQLQEEHAVILDAKIQLRMWGVNY